VKIRKGSSRGNPELRRVGIVYCVLIIATAAIALAIADIYHFGVPGTVVALAVGGGAPATVFLGWVTYRRDVKTDAPPQSPPDDTALLAAAVTEEWREEYLARRFADARPGLTVSWTARPDLMPAWDDLVFLALPALGGAPESAKQRVRSWADSPLDLAGAGRDLRAVLDRVPTGWLVVLGEPGSGKSMLALRLLLDLVERRTATDPVPVFVPLASWNPDAQPLTDWLEHQLGAAYGLADPADPADHGGRSRMAALLAEGKIMPILDGLDEMPPVVARKAIRALNTTFYRSDRPSLLVVTCRTAQYEAIVHGPGQPWNPVASAAAIELRPLVLAQVAAYLSGSGHDSRWDGVIAALADPDSALAKVLSVPLFASLASAVYNELPQHEGQYPPDPADLLNAFADPADVERHLLDRFIPAMYPDQRQAEDYRARREGRPPRALPVERRLMFLAAHLRRQDSPALRWWSMAELAPRWLPPAVVGTACGIASFFAAALGTHVGVGIGVGFGTGLLIALALGLGSRWAWWLRSGLGYQRRFGARRPGPGMTGGIIGAVIGGLAAGIAGQHHIGHEPSLLSGVPEGLGIAVMTGSTSDFTGGLAGGLVGSFVGGYLAAVGIGLPAGIVNGIGIALPAAFVVRYLGRQLPSTRRPAWSARIGIPAGLVVGLAIGLTVWRVAGPLTGAIIGVVAAAAACAPLGMWHVDEELTTVPSPGEALDRDTSAFWRTALSAGLATAIVAFAGLAMTSIYEVHATPTLGNIAGDGLGVGLSAGLIVGLWFGFYHAASPEFRIIIAWQALQRRLPWRLRRFLATAHKRTVLRQSGATYEFRHLLLRDRLADRYEKERRAAAAMRKGWQLSRRYGVRARHRDSVGLGGG